VAAEVTAAGGQGRFVGCDVTSPASVDTALAVVLDQDGGLDGVVHNAVSGLSGVPVDLATVPVDNLQDQVLVTLRATYLLARACLPHLQARGGSLVLLTSEAGFEGKARLGPYAAVKAAERGLARSLAREWGPLGVRVNCVAPLAGSDAMERAFLADPEMERRVLGRSALGRLGDATRDIGPVVRFLLSPEAGYVTGVTVMADGGSCPIS